MMKHKDRYAVAVRKPDGEIEIDREDYRSIVGNYHSLVKIPFVRGIFQFIDSMVLGMRTLTWSAGFEEEEDILTEQEAGKKERADRIMNGIVMVVSFVLAIAIFMVLPYGISNLFRKVIPSYLVRIILEGVIRIAIFVAYIRLISRMEDIRRLYQYHGAEHKCINCVEHGHPLTVKYVRESSKEHKRCGTSFILIVMVISILMFMVIRVDTIWMRMLSRIILVPVIAGISYEVLQCAGRSNSKFMDLVSRPGMWMQGLTTKEPDDSMIEVAIAATEAVFDWREYLTENFPGWEKQLEES